MTELPKVRALRGATTVEMAGVAADAARDATQEMLRTLLELNGLTVDDVVSALFTLTPDLYSAAPAHAARGAGWQDVPMLTATEAPADHSLPRCIRVMLHVETTRPRDAMRHVYLHGARMLRPDLLHDAEPPAP
jgi:chorismate mutase